MLKGIIFFIGLITFTDAAVIGEIPIKENVVAKGFDEILKINKKSSKSLYEGDIVQPETKNAIQDKTKRWPLTIAYVIPNKQFGREERSVINNVLTELSVRTCLTFVERTNEDDYLQFEKNGECSSGVGMSGGLQVVSIGDGCGHHGIVMHEVLHALGFWHEQSRTDRDDYVKIVWEVIQPGEEYNFNKYDSNEVDLMGVAYDYSSVMHYSATAFTTNGSATIIALKPGGDMMGQRDGLSKTDATKVNMLYECQVSYDSSGYTAWTSYSHCDINCMMQRQRFCDADSCSEWGKAEVESQICNEQCEVGHDTDCGPKTLTDFSGVVHSPLFPYAYKPSSTCKQTISGPEGSRIHLDFQVMDVEDYEGGCYFDFVHVYDGENNETGLLGTFCSTQLPNSIVSSSNKLTVEFISDVSVVKQGFYALYQFTMANLHVCNFDDLESYCGWTNDDSATLSYTSQSGSTPSVNTGPSNDHTSGNSFGRYLFLEASAAVNGDSAVLISPIFYPSYTTKQLCFNMWYSMYGMNIGTLNVYLAPNGVRETNPIISFTGGLNTNAWNRATYSLVATDKFQIHIKAVRDNGYMGDIAIDDLSLDEGACP